MRNALIKALPAVLLAVYPGFSTVTNAQQKEPSCPGDTWEMSSPEAEGLDAEAIELQDTEIRSGKHGFIDSMLIVRGGLPGIGITLGELLPHRNIDDPDKAGG
jgi:hypothetical protein